MNFIQRRLIKRYISDNKKNRDIFVTSLTKAKNVGVLCHISTEDTYKEIYTVLNKLESVTNRTVWMLGYVNADVVPEFCQSQPKVDFFCNKDLNWYGKPEKEQVVAFLKEDFDILIDFSYQSFDITRVLLAVSPAHFIVGAEKSNGTFYDLLINSDNTLPLMDLLDNVVRYTKNLAGE